MTHDPIFPKGIRANKNFTGAAYVNFLVPDTDATYDCQVYDVVFEPGCRNNWHSHGAGQLLLCTDGVGYYQEKGSPPGASFAVMWWRFRLVSSIGMVLRRTARSRTSASAPTRTRVSNGYRP